MGEFHPERKGYVDVVLGKKCSNHGQLRGFSFLRRVPIMRLNVQSSVLGWTYFGSVIDVLSVEPSEME